MGFFLYTQYIILRFYSEHQLRNDLATVKLKGSGDDNILKRVKGISFVEFGAQDVVRHDLVKKIITAYSKNENPKEEKNV